MLGGGGRHIGGPAHLIGSLQGPLAVLQHGAEGDVGVLLHQLLHCHFIDLQPQKSRRHTQGPLKPPAAHVLWCANGGTRNPHVIPSQQPEKAFYKIRVPFV